MMKKKSTMKKISWEERSVSVKICTVIIVILAVIAVFTVSSAVKKIHEAGSIASDSSIISSIKLGDYGNLVENSLRARAGGMRGNSDVTEETAVADYYESSYMHGVYVTNGDTAKAKAEETKMKDARSRMGDMSSFADDIDQKLANK